MHACVKVIENIEETNLMSSGSESRDSNIIFMEDCRDNQNASNVTSKYKCANGTEIVTEEVSASLPDKLYRKVNDDLFKCVLCSKTFTQKLILDGHLLSKHKDISDIEKRVTSKIHFCNYCSYRTINNYNLAKHLVSKHKKVGTQRKLKFKTFSCEHCEYSTKNQGNLMTHARTHSSVKEFLCCFCEKSFHQKANLNIHFLRYHAEAINVGESEKLFNNQVLPKVKAKKKLG